MSSTRNSIGTKPYILILGIRFLAATCQKNGLGVHTARDPRKAAQSSQTLPNDLEKKVLAIWTAPYITTAETAAT